MKILQSVANLFGFNKNSKYVDDHILEANVRSGIFMAAVIVILEVWLIIRQSNEYIIPAVQNGANFFDTLFQYTSNFWLFLLIGIAVFVFSFTFRRSELKPKTRLIVNCVAAGVAFAYGFLVFRENYVAWEGTKGILSNTLLIALYVFAMLLAVAIVVDTIITYKKGKNYPLLTFSVTILFALMCFAFGIKVSYSDYISSKPKEIICFLTMVVYGACMLVWRPYASIIMNIILFVAFFQLIDHATIGVATKNIPIDPTWDESYTEAFKDGYAQGFAFGALFKDGDLINYITFAISLTMVSISIYHQRRNEAIKDEELEYLANYDELTGLYNYAHFVRLVNAIEKREGKIVLFINVSNFKTYNDQRGFASGNKFLQKIGELLQKHFQNSIICRQSDDHFVLYTDAANFHEIGVMLNKDVAAIDPEIGLATRAGGYRIKNNEDTRRATDKARFACASLGSDLTLKYREYDDKMDDSYKLMQHVIHTIDTAASEGWIRPFYQPVVWSKDGTLCGVEALARWIDPEKGMLPPGKFVPTLEATKMVHKLDAAILEQVCRDIRRCIDEGLPFVPVSINFSRLDFELMDVVNILEGLVAKYNVPKEFLHVEITESALADDEGELAHSITTLKEKGYALWLDDFGSGYSSLNVLKDFDFDVMKIDMKFLTGFDDNKKAQPLIESVIAMAERMGMRTLTEGVETLGERDFLARANCERLQGYLFGKPITFDELQSKIKNGELSVSDNVM